MPDREKIFLGLILIFIAAWLFILTNVIAEKVIPKLDIKQNTTFIMVADSTIVTNENLSTLQGRFLDPQASCFVIANDTLSAIMEAISKMKDVHVIHAFKQINDTLYYMQLEKIKGPNEN